jgi:hypothetical protein
MTHLLLHKTPNSVSSEPGAAQAGKLEPRGGNGFLYGETNRGYVIDGGYFENYGASY